MEQYDYIIIGSGFGGSVSALRLSQKGYKVLVIEKGKWYKAKDFPKTNWNLRKWLWIPFLRFFGIMKLTIFRHAAVLSGTGVGGGSLVYANTLPIPKDSFFKTGSWSELKNWQEDLRPHYQEALRMLGAAKNPNLCDGDLALQQLSKKRGIEDKFEATNVAVYFGKPNETKPDPYFGGEGPERTGCNFCGACMTGCRFNAKNTLDKNYLYLAQQYGAKIIAEQEVYDVKPKDPANRMNGYLVSFKTSTSIFKRKQRVEAKSVIFAGGVLGTVKLLLKLKQASLPRLSDKLGDEIRTNNETLISVSTTDSSKDFSRGVAIGSILHTDENSHLEICRYGKGSDAWKLAHYPYSSEPNFFKRIPKIIWSFLKSPSAFYKVYIKNSWAKSTVVLLFMQTLDSTLKIKRNIFGGLSSSMSTGNKPTPFIPESIQLTKDYSEIVDGKATSFALETIAGIPSTAHILGGAVMGKDSTKGVINENNMIYGYENLYVIDGSMISANPGVNPSLSITAIAEHAMAQIPAKQREVKKEVEAPIHE